MAFADQLARIKTHAVTAGAAVSPAIDDVLVAFPAPKGRCVRIFYAGEQDPELIGDTINQDNVDELIHLSAFWPLSNLAEVDAAAVEVQVYAFKHAFRTAVDADDKLAGNATSTAVQNCEPGYAQIGGADYRTLDIDVVVGHTSYSVGS